MPITFRAARARRIRRHTLRGVAGFAAAAVLATASATIAPAAAAHAAAVSVATVGELATAFAAATPGTEVVLTGSFTGSTSDAPVAVPSGADVTLDLNGQHIELRSGWGVAGLAVPRGTSLTVTDSIGGGSLDAHAGLGAAGIGGNAGLLPLRAGDAGSITIAGGRVSAWGGYWAAGIGNGNTASGGSVTITGGTVFAQGGPWGAGIGSGSGPVGADVQISGGTVTAIGGELGAGIGSGALSPAGSTTISGSATRVTATGGALGAGIGGGAQGSGGTVNIAGGTVQASGGGGAALYGDGGDGGGSAIGGGGGGPILGDVPAASAGADVSITAGDVTVSAGGGAAVFGGGRDHAGTATPFGSLSNAGTLTLAAGSVLDIPLGVTADNSGTIVNEGQITGGGSIANTGSITRSPAVEPALAVAPHNYTLGFEANPPGVTGATPVAPMRVLAATVGNAREALPAPTRTGHVFTGWFAPGRAEPWSAATTIEADTALIARWALQSLPVAFDSRGGDAVAGITADFGTTISPPTVPARVGHRFLGWFTDPDASTAWDFATDTITAELTLYAGWALNDYRVSFDSAGGSAVPAVTVAHGEPVPVPATPTRAGHAFAGWFADAAGGSAWDFTAAVTGALALHARWTADAPVPGPPVPPVDPVVPDPPVKPVDPAGPAAIAETGFAGTAAGSAALAGLLLGAALAWRAQRSAGRIRRL